MSKVWFVLRHEIFTLTSRWSFWFGALGVPFIGFLVYAGVAVINQGNPEMGGIMRNPISGVGQLFAPPEETLPQGYIDQAGLVRSFPADFPRENWIVYPDLNTAQQALTEGAISGYYLIPPDYIENGRLLDYTPEYNLITAQGRSADLRALINYNLLGGDARLNRAVSQPLQNLEQVNLAPASKPQRDRNSELSFLLPYAVIMFSFISILGSSSLMLTSVAKEKENRIMEVLMLSATPHQLLLGKIAGLGLVGLLQVLVWGASG